MSQTDSTSVTGTQPFFNSTVIQQLDQDSPVGVTTLAALESVYGVTPVAQAATIAAVATTGATTELAGVETAVNAIRTALINYGIVAAS